MLSRGTNRLLSQLPSLLNLILLAAAAALLSGCMAMPLKKFEPKVVPQVVPHELLCDQGHLSMLEGEPETFHYVSPDHTNDKNTIFPTSFDKYSSEVEGSLPTDLQKDKVAVALSKYLASQSAQAQLNAQIADQQSHRLLLLELTSARIKSERDAIRKYSNPPKLTHGDMKRFANKLLGEVRLKPGAIPLTAPQPSRFVFYFTALYRGPFYDRMSNPAQKPQISLTISDSEITAAETVFLEYVIDLLDKTPVMLNTSVGGTIFYPGNSSSAPTAYQYNPQNSVQIPPGSPNACGITQQNVWLLRDLANGASDEAATVGGLVANTWGGFSFGVPVLNLKLSIGDNQTLSSIVKTAASEAGLRLTLMAAYWSLRHLKLNISDPSS